MSILSRIRDSMRATPPLPEESVELPMSRSMIPISRTSNEQLMSLYEDVKLRASTAETGNITEAVKIKGRQTTPALGYQKPQVLKRDHSRRRDRGLNYEPAPYDLRELARARDTESLINTSAERHVEIALQEGVHWDGNEQELVDYMKKREFEMFLVSNGVTLYKILNQLLDQLIVHGTAYMIVRREKSRSSGNAVRMFGKKLDPITAWGVADAPSMYTAYNTRGHSIGYKQVISEAGILTGGTAKTRFFDPEEVFVFTRHKQPGRAFGRSLYLPVLDDALMLRSLEDLVYVLSQKYTFPLFQYIIGTEKHPAKDIALENGGTISEVEYAKGIVEEMPVEGGWVTSERHEVKLIGTEGKVLDLSKYLAHFRQRVQDATRMSNAVLGTGSSEQSKSTAQTQMQFLQESAKYLQDVISDGFQMFIFQLLMEGGFDVTYKNMIKLSFSAPDTEEQRAAETHEMEKYNNGLTTCEEARQALGSECFTEKQKKDTRPQMEHEKQKELARMAAAAKAASASSSTASKNSTSTKAKPKNQSGSSTKKKITKNDFREEILLHWASARDAALNHKPVDGEPSMGYNRATSPAMDSMVESFRLHMGQTIHDSTTEARMLTDKPFINVTLKQRKQIFHGVRQAMKRVLRDTVGEGFPDGNKVLINAAFSSCKASLIDTLKKEILFVDRASFVAGLHNAGVEKVSVKDKRAGSSATMLTSDYCSKLLHLLDENMTIEVE